MIKKLLVTLPVFLVIFLGVAVSSCTRVGTGEIGIVVDYMKQIKNEPVVNTFEIHLLDELVVVDGTQVRVPVENVKAKDVDGILFEDIDAQITYNVDPLGAVEFFKVTKEIDHTDEGSFVGFRFVTKEAKNALVKTFTQFKAIQVNTEKSTIEEKLKQMLTDELDKRYPNTFKITDVNIDSAQLDQSVESVLQNQALIDSEKRTVESQIELQKMKSKMLDEELIELKTSANKAGISINDLMRYKNDKERNRVLSELARTGGTNTQVQIKE